LGFGFGILVGVVRMRVGFAFFRCSSWRHRPDNGPK